MFVTCPPPKGPPGPPRPPAPIPPGPARQFEGVHVGRTIGSWWRAGDSFGLRLGQRVGSTDGYGSWSDAVEAARLLSKGAAGAVAVCDDRDRLYLHVVVGQSLFFGEQPLQLGARGEIGYAFYNALVRGIVDGPLLASRGECLLPRIPLPKAG